MTPKQFNNTLLAIPFIVGYALVMKYIKDTHLPPYIKTALQCWAFIFWDLFYLYTISHS